MHRFAFAAAVCGTLVVAACSDQTPTEPTAPPPEQFISPSCQPSPHFPIVQVSGLILKVFPKGRLQLEAQARGAAIALFWETCRVAAAQKAAVDFVNFMNANSSNLIGTQTQRNTLISLVLNGVDIPFTTPPGGTGDFGVGFFDPGTTTNTVVKTLNGTALVELEPGSFNQPTTIVVSRKSDGFALTDFDGDQFPPYFDYDAINAAGDHVLKNGKTAIVAFCLLDPVYTYPENPRIGHNPVVGAPGFPFEVLEEVNLAEDHPGLAAQLNCGNLAPNTIIIGGFGRGLPGLANAAWSTARYYLAPAARALFLPEALHAATLAVGTLPPPAGRTPSLSPFGIVEFSPPPPVPTNFGSGGWSYKQISNFDPVPSTLITPTAADGWATGTAPFGTITTCGGLLAPSTPWTLNTTMLLRRDVLIPANTSSAAIDILFDNDVHVFVNGWDVSNGLISTEGCANLHPVHLVVPASTGPASAGAPLVAGQVNKIFIRGVDRGGQSYLDAKITLTPN